MQFPGKRFFFVASSLFAVAVWANEMPVATDDAADHHGGTVLVVDVLANDSDADGEALEIYDVASDDCSGSLTVDFGVVTLTPYQGAPEACTITYSIRDENDNSSTATVTVNSGTLLFRDDCELGDDSRWDGNVQ